MAGDAVDSMDSDILMASGGQYSTMIGFVYVFNLIVGTGALTMPAAFHEAGWLLSLVAIVALAFMSYLTLTFMTETMAISNAKIRFYRVVASTSNNGLRDEETVQPVDSQLAEQEPLLNNSPPRYSDVKPSFEITHRVEMGTMASMYFNKVGMGFFHLCVIVYLYGDLAIYAAAVPKSLRDVVCTYRRNDSGCNQTEQDGDPCWSESVAVDRMDAYRIFVAVFLLLLGPFVFFNVQKTKYLQMFTSLARWLAFGLMIVFAAVRLGRGEGTGRPAVASLAGVPNLFGVCVYSFMCHHSLPSLVTPIRDKSRLLPMLAGNFCLILVFYLVLSITGVYAVSDVRDLYTLNFQPRSCDPVTGVVAVQYFLVLFPVFTLSTNFPIIAITLRNNLVAALASRGGPTAPAPPRPMVARLVCPILALLPPVAVAMATNQVEFLVGVTGSYAGAGIQYVIPACLVLLARKDVLAIPGDYRHRSPFSHTAWAILALGWAVLCMGFVTANHIITGE